MTREDFDFKKETLNINKTWGYHKDAPEGFGETKNKQSIRKISVDKETLKLFKDFFNKTEVHEDNEHRLVFFNDPNTKYKVISNTYVNRVLREILKELDIEPIITIHGLRHTHASLLIYKKDISINYISERLGHGDVTTTHRRYSHVIRELREKDEKRSKEVISCLFKKHPKVLIKMNEKTFLSISSYIPKKICSNIR